MNRKRDGFTLIELLVVVLILGILASYAVPQYMKTVETSKATDAVGMVQMVAAGYRMCNLDNPTSTTACATLLSLAKSKYIADNDWTTGPYSYEAGISGGARAKRSQYNPNGTVVNAPYKNWGYVINASGVCSTLTTDTPACPV